MNKIIEEIATVIRDRRGSACSSTDIAKAVIACIAGGELPQIANLIITTRNKLERRFQASDFVPERVGGREYALAAEICVEVMTQIRDAHQYIDEADIKLRGFLSALKESV